MTFAEALQAAKEGKKIRKSCWSNQYYVYFGVKELKTEKSLRCEDDSQFVLYLLDTSFDDWEIYEEKRELSWNFIQYCLFKYTELGTYTVDKLKIDLGFK